MLSQYGRCQRSCKSCRNHVSMLQDPPYETPQLFTLLRGCSPGGIPLNRVRVPPTRTSGGKGDQTHCRSRFYAPRATSDSERTKHIEEQIPYVHLSSSSIVVVVVVVVVVVEVVVTAVVVVIVVVLGKTCSEQRGIFCVSY
ncbi:hypothetical protein ElyMa_006827900 [Elysia marginata]|uniref:Uncharacterized protein n=1 Tax=Elysia marginata TaxID=1093978 RepID=A0AAV4J9N1_9GAST|nr:hypothetical protein ElyMa_006827900 [Elysia marginata]